MIYSRGHAQDYEEGIPLGVLAGAGRDEKVYCEMEQHELDRMHRGGMALYRSPQESFDTLGREDDWACEEFGLEAKEDQIIPPEGIGYYNHTIKNVVE